MSKKQIYTKEEFSYNMNSNYQELQDGYQEENPC